MNHRWNVYRKCLWCLFAAGTAGLCVYAFYFFHHKIPDEIRLNVREEQDFDWQIPVSASFKSTSVQSLGASSEGKAVHIDMAQPFSVVGKAEGSYVMDCRLFGIIPLKSVPVSVTKKQYVIPGGYPIGIYLRTNGVLAIGTSPVTAADGLDYEPARNIIHSGDYIETVNGQPLNGKEELVEAVAACDGEEVLLGVRRNGEQMRMKVEPVLGTDGMYRLGVWVRDNTQGIGTLTYVDAEGRFGALGHGINDIDTNTLMEIEDGTVYEAEILSVVKGEKGTPGELMGMISYNRENLRGEIERNTAAGIFGQAGEVLTRECAAEPVEIGLKQEIVPGSAVIRSCIDGELKEYEVEILEIHLSGDSVNKGIVLKVTDEELLKKTGGIVQGMSGSPILQNGKMIGAVTHVFVQDSAKGFGIFLENMINMQKK